MLSDIVRFIFSLSGLAVSVVAGALWRRARPRAAGPRRYLAAVVLAYAFASIYSVNYLLGRLLIIGFHPFSQSDVPSGRTAEVVLGSGTFTARDWSGGKFSILDAPAAMRVIEAVRVYRMAQPEWVISSGGIMTAAAGLGSSGGITMRDELVRLGVPAERILVESESGNTYDEGRIIAPMLQSLHAEHVILVTSELHMRRSVGVFRAAGIEVVPAEARGIFTTLPWYLWFIPSDQGLQEAELLYHEVLGIPYYRLRGWSK